MDNKHFDAFLDDATHTLVNTWEDMGEAPLSVDELYELNDLLTAFFGSRRIDHQ